MSAGAPPRKVVLYQLLSLDGVAEEPGDWFSDGGPELLTNLDRTIATQDDVLLGRGTYDYWCEFWPTSDMEPFASFINGVQKHVFASSEPETTWANSTVVTTDPAEYVEALKHETGGDIGIHGSISLAQSLLRDRVIDELRLVVAPVIAGRGRRLFPDDSALDQLELVELDRSGRGTLFLYYRRRTGQ